MKKLFIVTLAALVSACACFDCEDDVTVTDFHARREAKMNCDYFDGRTCYRYVYNDVKRPVAKPAPVRYLPCNAHKPVYQPKPACNTCNSCNSCAPCQTKISEKREPVEVVYKKTTYKTIYEPKTYSQVSYESAPYASSDLEDVEVIVDNE